MGRVESGIIYSKGRSSFSPLFLQASDFVSVFVVYFVWSSKMAANELPVRLRDIFVKEFKLC